MSTAVKTPAAPTDINLPVLYQHGEVPATLEDCYAFFRSNDIALDTVNSLVYWRRGEVLKAMQDQFEIPKPVEAVAREVGLCARQLNYCKDVFEAFEYDQVSTLCRKGLKWSTLRILASTSVEPFRERLLQLFMEDKATDLEIRTYAERLRGDKNLSLEEDPEGEPVIVDGTPADGADPRQDDIDRKFSSSLKKVDKKVHELCEDIQKFRSDLSGDLSDALLDDQGNNKEGAVSSLSEANDQLLSLIMESVELVTAAHILCCGDSYLFEMLDSRLAEIRARFEVEGSKD